MKNLLIVLSLLLTTFISVAQTDNDKQAKIDLLFKDIDKNASPGAAIGIIKNGALIYSQGYGLANLDYQIPLSADSKFYIASIAKQFTAACIALLSLEGKLNLDDDIWIYFPDMPMYDEIITIDDMVHHTSGLRDYLSMMYLSGKSFEDYFNNDDAVALIKRQKGLNFLPNEEYLYSNSGYILLAEIVGKASGMTIREYADKHIFQPLGMSNTFFNDDHAQITKDRVVSYRNIGKNTFNRFVQNFDGHGDGGMISTVNDLYLWDQNFYHKKVGGEAFIELMHKCKRLKNGQLIDYSFGLNQGSFKGLKIVMHGGNFLGFNHPFTRFPEQNFSVIVLANDPNIDPYFITDRISDLFLEDAYDKKIDNSSLPQENVNYIKLSSKKLEKFCGKYWNMERNFSREIYSRNDALIFKRNRNNESLLIPIAQNEFKMMVNGNVKVKFDLKDSEPNEMTVTVTNGKVFNYESYDDASYSIAELKDFTGSYFSEELNCTYELHLEEGELILSIEGLRNSKLKAIMKDYFVNDVIGAIKFTKENPRTFVIKSNRVRNIEFNKM